MKTWKTKDGEITLNHKTGCFTYIGDSANDAMHKMNKLRRKYNLTQHQSDAFFVDSLDRKLKCIII